MIPNFLPLSMYYFISLSFLSQHESLTEKNFMIRFNKDWLNKFKLNIADCHDIFHSKPLYRFLVEAKIR